MITDADALDVQIQDTFARLRAVNGHGVRARLAALSGVNESTLREMARPDYRPRPIDNLVRVHAGLAALAAEQAGDAAVSGGVAAQAEAAGQPGEAGGSGGDGVKAAAGASVHGATLADRGPSRAPNLSSELEQGGGR